MVQAVQKQKQPIVRLAGKFITPPGIMGFANLTEPDVAFNTSKFKINWHPTDDQATALADKIDAHVVDPLWEKFLKDADEKKAKAPSKGFIRPLGMDWVEEHTKDAREGSKIELPYIVFNVGSDYNDRDGVAHRRTIMATDMGGNPVDLKTARVGMGSVIQVLTSASIWASALSKGQAALSFKLIGIRILKLEQYGGGGKMEEVSAEDLALLGEGFQADDLSGYVSAKKASPSPRDEPLDEEIPF